MLLCNIFLVCEAVFIVLLRVWGDNDGTSDQNSPKISNIAGRATMGSSYGK